MRRETDIRPGTEPGSKRNRGAVAERGTVRRRYLCPELERETVLAEFFTGSIEVSDVVYRGDGSDHDIYSWNDFF